MSDGTFSASRVISADAQKIFDLLADPKMHPVLDGSGTVKRSLNGNPERLELGAKFRMSMRIGAPYRISNKVVEFEEGKRIAWRHLGRHVWRYELEPAGGATKVTETLDYGKAPVRVVFAMLGSRANKRYLDAITGTLERIEQQVTSA